MNFNTFACRQYLKKNKMNPLKTFIIYARSDEDYKKQLLLHLRPLVSRRAIEVWHDDNILPGE